MSHDLKTALAEVIAEATALRVDERKGDVVFRCGKNCGVQAVVDLLTSRMISDAAAECSESEPMFYLQDARTYVGNSPMWWAKGDNGYTTRLDHAQRYTKEEVNRRRRTRETDVPWACAIIDALAGPVADMQNMHKIAKKLRGAA